MPSVDVFSKAGAKVGSVELPAVFSSPVNEALMHQAAVSQLAGRRTGTHASKTVSYTHLTLPTIYSV